MPNKNQQGAAPACTSRQPGQMRSGTLPNGCPRWVATPKNQPGGQRGGMTRSTTGSGTGARRGSRGAGENPSGYNPNY